MTTQAISLKRDYLRDFVMSCAFTLILYVVSYFVTDVMVKFDVFMNFPRSISFLLIVLPSFVIIPPLLEEGFKLFCVKEGYGYLGTVVFALSEALMYMVYSPEPGDLEAVLGVEQVRTCSIEAFVFLRCVTITMHVMTTWIMTTYYKGTGKFWSGYVLAFLIHAVWNMGALFILIS